VRRLLLALALASGCYASNTLAPEERVVATEAPRRSWRAATKDDLPGFWASTSVQGGSAGALLKAYYVIDAEGGYTGAALVLTEGRARFVVLAEDGRWTLDEGGLDLHDGGPPAQAWVDGGHLRLVAGDSAIELTRVPLD
jgi:hypothetical protein